MKIMHTICYDSLQHTMQDPAARERNAPMPTVKPISELQRNMGAIARECHETGEPIYLTKNGSASLVVMDAEAFDRLMAVHDDVYERESRVYDAIMRGLEDMNAGRVRTLDQAIEDAAKMRAMRDE